MLLLLSLLLTPLDGLAAPSWHRREAASAALYARGELALPTLWLGRCSADAEVVARCRRIAYRLACDRADAALAGMRPEDFPFLDSVWYDTAARSYGQPWPSLNEYLCAARACPDPAFEAVKLGLYRQATREWMQDGVAQGVPAWCYRVAFVELRRRDGVYLGATGASRSVMVTVNLGNSLTAPPRR